VWGDHLHKECPESEKKENSTPSCCNSDHTPITTWAAVMRRRYWGGDNRVLQQLTRRKIVLIEVCPEESFAAALRTQKQKLQPPQQLQQGVT
jgi:hypothetical protein